MQQYRNNRNNGNIYDLRKDLQHSPPPSQPQNTAGSADGRYGFNGEPLSFKPSRTAGGTVRRTRTDNSIEFPAQPRRTAESQPRTRSQSRSAQAQSPRSRTAQPQRQAAGNAQPPRKAKKKKPASRAAQQRYQNQRLRPAQQRAREPVQREKRKKRKMTRAAIKRRRMMRCLAALATLAAVIAAGIYLTVTMLFKIGTLQVQTADGTAVQQAGGYSSTEILQALGVNLEENIFSFDPAEKEAALERQFPLLEAIQVVRQYPNTVVVRVTEAVPTYAIQTEKGWLTLSDTFKILACDAARPEGLKTLYGGAVSTATPGEPLRFAAENTAESGASESEAADTPEDADKKIEALAALQAKLEEYGMLDDVTRIEFADTAQMAFLYQDRISVLLGTLNDLDYKLDRARYVLTNAVSTTDTGGLDFSHVSAASTTRKFYLAQGAPTLPSGYVVPEKAEPEPTDTADTTQAGDAAGAAEEAQTAQTGADPAAGADAAQDETPLTDPARMTANDEENPM